MHPKSEIRTSQLSVDDTMIPTVAHTTYATFGPFVLFIEKIIGRV